MTEELEAVLVCQECGEHSDEAAERWRAFPTVDDQVATYRPSCAEAEFGGRL